MQTELLNRLQYLRNSSTADDFLSFVELGLSVADPRSDPTAILRRLELIRDGLPEVTLTDRRKLSPNSQNAIYRHLLLWIGARELLYREGVDQTRVSSLIESAIDASLKLPDRSVTVAILWEWNQRSQANGDLRNCNSLQRRLTSILFPETPVAPLEPTQGAPISIDRTKIPFKEYEIFLRIQLLKLANQAGNFDRSAELLRELGSRGEFVEIEFDDTMNPNPAMEKSLSIFESKASQMSKDLNALFSSELMATIEKFESNINPDQRYSLLHAVAFPANFPGRLCLYPPSNHNETPSHTIAWELSQAAVAASKTNELSRDLTSEGIEQQYRAQQLILQLALAIESKDLASAQRLLNSIPLREGHAISPDTNIQLNNMALEAAQWQPLEKESIETLKRVLMSGTNLVTRYEFSGAMPELTDPSPTRYLHRIAKYHFHLSEKDPFCEFLESLLQVRAEHYAQQSSDDQGRFRKILDLALFGKVLMQYGAIDEGLDMYKRSLEIVRQLEDRSKWPNEVAEATLALRSLPAEARYQFWKEWTLPEIRSPRLHFLFMESNSAPLDSVAEDADRNRDLKDERKVELITSWTELIHAAKELGQLPDLAQALTLVPTSIGESREKLELILKMHLNPQEVQAEEVEIWLHPASNASLAFDVSLRQRLEQSILVALAAKESGLIDPISSKRLKPFGKSLKEAGYKKAAIKIGIADPDVDDQ